MFRYLFNYKYCFLLQAPIVKEYPAKLRLTSLQCLFSCIQSTVFAIAVERDPSSWKLGWDINLFSVAYCVCFLFTSIYLYVNYSY